MVVGPAASLRPHVRAPEGSYPYPWSTICRILDSFRCRFQCFFGASFRSDSGAHFGNRFGSKNRFQVQSVARSDHRFVIVTYNTSTRKCPNLSGVFCKVRVPKWYRFWFPFWAPNGPRFGNRKGRFFGIPLRAGSDASSMSFCEDAAQSRNTFCDSQHVFAGAHTRVPGWWRRVALAIHRRSKHVRACWVPKRWAS